MIRLHLVGFTPDLKGLVFSGRRGGRSGTYWVPVDESVWKALEQLERARADQEQARAAAKASGSTKRRKGKSGLSADEVEALISTRGRSRHKPEAEPEPEPEPGPTRPESKLTPREVQQLLREGRTVRDVAARAGTDEAWVERFIGPVIHEINGIVSMTRAAHQNRPRLGPSGLPVGDAVRRNLQDRRATQETLEAIQDGWDAKRTRTGAWRVRLVFTHRGKKRTAEWDFSKEDREVRPRNQLARELGWWPAPAQGRVPASEAPDESDAGDDTDQGSAPAPKRSARKAAKTTKRQAKPRAKSQGTKRSSARGSASKSTRGAGKRTARGSSASRRKR